jgi:signal peptidase I
MRRGWLVVGASAAALLVMAGGATGGALTLAAASTAAPGTISLRVSSISMLPTLRVGQTITVDLRAYQTRRPSIGDLVVFHPPRGADSFSPKCGAAREGIGRPRVCGVPRPRASKETFVERLVALPGDRIFIRDGHVIRNGVREKDHYIARCGSDSDCNFPTPVVMPPGDFFMMGDNRGLSDDSRFWGPVHRSWILGKVVGREQ